MPLAFPGRNVREVRIPRTEAIDAASPERRALAFDARLDRAPPTPVRLAFYVKNRQGWFYQTASLVSVPHDGWRRVVIDFSPTSPVWEAWGHARPWDALSARGITLFGIELFCGSETEGTFRLRSVRWERSGGPPPGPGIRVLDIRGPVSPLRLGELWELAFRTARTDRDPYDPREIDLSCEIVTPEGRTERRHCFLYQDYEELDGALVATGAPEWRVRYRPGAEGKYRHNLLISRDGSGRRETISRGGFTVSGRRAGAAAGDGARSVEAASRDEFVLDLGDRPKNGWRPELAPLAASWDGAAFKRGREGPPRRVWRPVLEWTARWGSWEGVGAYDLGAAWRFDRALRRAEAQGISLPLAVLDDGPFLEHGKYRWPRNPFFADEGGLLASPGEFFRSDEARRYFLRRFRYLVARYGHSPAVSSWCIAAALPAPGVAEWHDRIGKDVRALPLGPPGGKPLVSLHPSAVPYRKEISLGDFEAGAPAGWRADTADAPGARFARVLGGGDGDALGFTFPSPGPPTHATVWRTLDDDLSRYDCLTFDVRMPENAAGVGRAQVVLRDRDLLWFEHLVETPLRAGDWTRCVVDLGSAADKFRPVGHKRPWTAYTRGRIKAVAIRVFPNGPAGSEARLDRVRLCAGPRRPARPLEVRIVDAGSKTVGRFEKYEMVLGLSEEFSNPFDPDTIAVEAVFRPADGSKEKVAHGFYYEPY
ncbi:MAG: hypothetical protein ACYS9X_30890, partial [Planctomycetota bacterium]